MKQILYYFLFIAMNVFAGSSESDDELALPIAADSVTQPRLCDAQDYPLDQFTRARSNSAPPSMHPSLQSNSDHPDIEALTIKERISRNRMKIALAGLATTTIASTVSLTLYFAECDQTS